MRAIWKFPIGWVGPITISMPDGAKVLCVQTQSGNPHMWCEVDTEARLVDRKFRVMGTGHRMPQGQCKYIGTYQVLEGTLVWHLFEELP